ncbi:MAG: flagellar hook capping FlgD N-terminal domain-containing protein, partial [Pseudomonadota bacterium]
MIDSVINTLNATQKSSSSTGSTSKASDISNTFYKLLTAQIQYQDPLNPMENTEFTSQLAQLSTVEQLEKVNTNLNYQQLYMASLNNSQAIGFIGKDVKAVGQTITKVGTNPADANYILNSDAARVVVNIYDQNNNLIRTILEGNRSTGENTTVWDGKNNGGGEVPAGTYKFEVLATDVDGKAVASTTMLSGLVDGITFENGVTYITVKGQKIAIGDVISIGTHVEA